MWPKAKPYFSWTPDPNANSIETLANLTTRIWRTIAALKSPNWAASMLSGLNHRARNDRFMITGRQFYGTSRSLQNVLRTTCHVASCRLDSMCDDIGFLALMPPREPVSRDACNEP